MTHFLERHVRERAPTFIVGAHAFVRVRVSYKEKSLTIDVDDKEPTIMVCKNDIVWVELPEEWRVKDPEGHSIKPSGTFCVTTESFDPFHGLIDLAESKKRW